MLASTDNQNTVTRILTLLLLLPTLFFAQSVDTLEKHPVFPACGNVTNVELPSCFNTQVQQFLVDNFKVPSSVSEEELNPFNVQFEVTTEGIFEVIYTDSNNAALKEETARVFASMPTIVPTTYNGTPAISQFIMPVIFPLVVRETVMNPMATAASTNPALAATPATEIKDTFVNEYELIENMPFDNEEYSSQLNIPLSHEMYTRFDAAMNRVGTNTHTAQKPYIYSEVNKYYNFSEENSTLIKERSTWLGRKWWNEHFVTIKGEDYWFTLDPGLDLQVGRDFDNDLSTYNNTRLVNFQGGLGKTINFNATVYESQGRFPAYIDRYARSIKPDGGNPGIVPGRGIAAQFKEDSFDYPVATGNVSITPSKYFNVQLGHGKQFLGDGYRSLFFSDNATPFPYFKLNTTFWKFKYTNTWMSLRDVRPEVTADGSFRTKYIANHYLSYNVTERLNIGLFESVIWQNDNDRGFDFNYLNPVIFYRAIEFSTGSRGGNALLGLSGKYKVNDKVNLYGQFIIDEFSTSDVFGGEGSYKNKTGYQVGVKYYNAFKIDNLYLQAEYNRVRPFAYSHNTIILNYGHNNQPLAHTLGANFSELIAIARYRKDRWYGDAKVIVAKRGLELNEDNIPFYGGNIYGTEDNRLSDDGNDLGQGNSTNFFHTELEGGYLINPTTNLKVYASVIYRDFNPEINNALNSSASTVWLNFGLRTDLFNWYYDY